MPKPSLLLNMIVRNEADRMERCLRSALPYVKAVVILDTGSTDRTKEIILDLCDAADVPCTIKDGQFKDFSQARNEAFWHAQKMNVIYQCHFALLMDADMELVVDKGFNFGDLNANDLGYNMMQKAGAISYANRRLLNLHIFKAPYVGVTHEYIDVACSGTITKAHFIDYADGANRKDKFIRDAQLIEEALKTDPNNSRYWFYLGNTYRDWAGTEKEVLQLAVNAYKKRIEIGGWDEETHSAMMNLAFCMKDGGDGPKFVAWMLEAYNFRPSRVEPLYELAKYYREKGESHLSIIFAKAGLKHTRPDDLLFVNDFAYSHGCRYEYSISGYYDEKERSGAFSASDDIALDPAAPPDVRWSARSNLFWHTAPLSQYCPSFSPKELNFTPPDGYTAMNPSVEECNGAIHCNIRTVNYRINEAGQYMIGEKGCNDAPIDTRNFLCRLTDDLQVVKPREIIWDRPPAKFPMVTGLEDIRLWRYCGDLYFTATIREQSEWGQCQIIQGKLVHDIDDNFMFAQECKVLSMGNTMEKNWMPMPSRPFGAPRFLYRLDTIVEPDEGTIIKEPLKIHVENISGGSQLIPFKSGLLGVVHEASNDPTGKRTYWHRFVWLTPDGECRRVSIPFVFMSRQIEFCAGLCRHPNHNDLILSFGVKDEKAYVATISMEEVAMMLWKFHED